MVTTSFHRLNGKSYTHLLRTQLREAQWDNGPGNRPVEKRIQGNTQSVGGKGRSEGCRYRGQLISTRGTHPRGLQPKRKRRSIILCNIYPLSYSWQRIFLLRATSHALASLLQPHLFLLAILVSVALSSPSLPRSTTSYRHLTAVCASFLYSTIAIIDRYDPLQRVDNDRGYSRFMEIPKNISLSTWHQFRLLKYHLFLRDNVISNRTLYESCINRGIDTRLESSSKVILLYEFTRRESAVYDN